MACSSKGESDAMQTDGIVDAHAYGVVDCRLNVAGSGLDMIQLRNPWGHGECNNCLFVRDHGSGWGKYPQIKDVLKPVDDDPGVFWLTRGEFFKYYSRIYLSGKSMAEFLEVEQPISESDEESEGDSEDDNWDGSQDDSEDVPDIMEEDEVKPDSRKRKGGEKTDTYNVHSQVEIVSVKPTKKKKAVLKPQSFPKPRVFKPQQSTKPTISKPQSFSNPAVSKPQSFQKQIVSKPSKFPKIAVSKPQSFPKPTAGTTWTSPLKEIADEVRKKKEADLLPSKEIKKQEAISSSPFTTPFKKSVAEKAPTQKIDPFKKLHIDPNSKQFNRKEIESKSQNLSKKTAVFPQRKHPGENKDSGDQRIPPLKKAAFRSQPNQEEKKESSSISSQPWELNRRDYEASFQDLPLPKEDLNSGDILEDTLEEFVAECDMCENKSRGKDSSLNSLYDALDKANRKAKDFQQKGRKLIIVGEELEALCRKQKVKLDSAKKEKKGKDKLSDSLRKQLGEAKESIKLLEQSQNNISNEKQKHLRAREAQLNNRTLELKRANEKIEELNQKLKMKERQNKEGVDDKLRAKDNELAFLKRELKEAKKTNNDPTKLSRRQQQTEKLLEKLEEQLNESEEALQEYREKLNNKTSELEEVNGRVKKMEVKLLQKKSQREKLENKSSALFEAKRRAKEKEKEIHFLRNKINRMVQTNNKKSKEAADKMNQKDTRIQALHKQLHVSKKRNEEQRNEQRENAASERKRALDLQAKLDRQISQSESQRRNMDSLKASLDAKQRAIDSRTESLREKEKLIQSLKMKVTDSKNENKESHNRQRERAAIERKNALEMKAQLDRQTKLSESLKKKMAKLMTSLESQRSAMDDAMEEKDSFIRSLQLKMKEQKKVAEAFAQRDTAHLLLGELAIELEVATQKLEDQERHAKQAAKENARERKKSLDLQSQLYKEKEYSESLKNKMRIFNDSFDTQQRNADEQTQTIQSLKSKLRDQLIYLDESESTNREKSNILADTRTELEETRKIMRQSDEERGRDWARALNLREKFDEQMIFSESLKEQVESLKDTLGDKLRDIDLLTDELESKELSIQLLESNAEEQKKISATFENDESVNLVTELAAKLEETRQQLLQQNEESAIDRRKALDMQVELDKQIAKSESLRGKAEALSESLEAQQRTTNLQAEANVKTEALKDEKSPFWSLQPTVRDRQVSPNGEMTKLSSELEDARQKLYEQQKRNIQVVMEKDRLSSMLDKQADVSDSLKKDLSKLERLLDSKQDTIDSQSEAILDSKDIIRSLKSDAGSQRPIFKELPNEDMDIMIAEQATELEDANESFLKQARSNGETNQIVAWLTNELKDSRQKLRKQEQRLSDGDKDTAFANLKAELEKARRKIKEQEERLSNEDIISLVKRLSAELEETKRKLRKQEQRLPNSDSPFIATELATELGETKHKLRTKEKHSDDGGKATFDKDRFLEMEAEFNKLIDVSRSLETSLNDKQRTIDLQTQDLEENNRLIRALREKVRDQKRKAEAISNGDGSILLADLAAELEETKEILKKQESENLASVRSIRTLESELDQRQSNRRAPTEKKVRKNSGDHKEPRLVRVPKSENNRPSSTPPPYNGVGDSINLYLDGLTERVLAAKSHLEIARRKMNKSIGKQPT
jgi:hypothetical protein